MTDIRLNNIWSNARRMVASGWRVIPLVPNGKKPVWEEWQRRGVNTLEGVETLARDYPTYNYGMYREDAATIDIDLLKRESATLDSELNKLYEILGYFEPRFMQKTGSGGYHIPFNTHGREIHAQPLTDISEIKGWHGQIVGAGSIHPRTNKPYEICGGFDPSDLTELTEATLDKLARSHATFEAQQIVMPDNKDEHPPCIQYLLERGAPSSKSKKEIDYNRANLLLANYAVARGYSDDVALWLAQEMATHTTPDHPTSKSVNDKIMNFRSALSSARREPMRYQFACGYMRASKGIKEDACTSECPNFGNRVKAAAPIPTIKAPEGDFTMSRLLGANRKYLHIDEDYNISIIPTVIVANRLEADVDVIIIVGPSGSIKTELLRQLGEDENQFIYPISTITEHTLASGLPDNEDLAPRLRGRTLVIKDLTSILSKRDDIVGLIFADIRELTDGYIQKEFGSGAKKRHKGLHSSILAASTPAIERYQSLFNLLGSRILLVRPANDKLIARQRSWLNQKSLKIKGLRAELNKEMFGFVCSEIARLEANPDEYKQLSDENAEKIGVWCDTLAILRTYIERDRHHNVVYYPEPEYATRLVNSICKITQVHAFLYREDPNDPKQLAIACRLVYDNIPSLRLRVLPYLSMDKTTSSRVSEAANVSTNIARNTLEDLYTLGICDKQARDSKEEGEDRRTDDYWLSDKKYFEFIQNVVIPMNEYLDALNRGTTPVFMHQYILMDMSTLPPTYRLSTSVKKTYDLNDSNAYTSFEGLRKRIYQAVKEIRNNDEALDEDAYFERVVKLVVEYSDAAFTPDLIKQYLAKLIEDNDELAVRGVIEATARS